MYLAGAPSPNPPAVEAVVAVPRPNPEADALVVAVAPKPNPPVEAVVVADAATPTFRPEPPRVSPPPPKVRPTIWYFYNIHVLHFEKKMFILLKEDLNIIWLNSTTHTKKIVGKSKNFKLTQNVLILNHSNTLNICKDYKTNGMMQKDKNTQIKAK